MIKSLSILNFQSHKSSKLIFDKGVNVIVGSSDSGKSAIIRALLKLVRNRPIGDSFRSNWGGDTIITGEFDDNTVSFEMRDGSKNAYRLNKLPPFQALKTDVPEEIQKAININEVNFQQQLDAPYLLSSTPGEVARHFNKITHLDKIDKSISSIKKWTSTLSSTLESKVKEQEKQKVKLKTFDYLEEMQTEVEELEQLEIDIAVKQKSFNTLNKLILDFQYNELQIQTQSHILEIEQELEKLIKLDEKIDGSVTDFNALENLLKDLNDNQKTIDEYTVYLSIENTVSDLLKIDNEIELKSTEYNKLQKLVVSLKTISSNIEQAERRYNTLHKELEEKTPNKCPFCKGDLK